MLLNTARIPARAYDEGNLLRLQEQDRARWDQPMIARGTFHFAWSAAGEQITEYHLQSGIAACHGTAKDYDSTGWRLILSHYDRLVESDDSPVIAEITGDLLSPLRGARRIRGANKPPESGRRVFPKSDGTGGSPVGADLSVQKDSGLQRSNSHLNGSARTLKTFRAYAGIKGRSG